MWQTELLYHSQRTKKSSSTDSPPPPSRRGPPPPTARRPVAPGLAAKGRVSSEMAMTKAGAAGAAAAASGAVKPARRGRSNSLSDRNKSEK